MDSSRMLSTPREGQHNSFFKYVTGKAAQPPFEDWEVCLYDPPPQHRR